MKLLKTVLAMGNKIIIGILVFTAITLLSILVIAFHNYTTTNCCIQKTLTDAEYTIVQTNAIVRNQLELSEAHKETLRRQESLFIKHLSDIKDLSKGIIDSNVLTFLFSALMIFFAGLLFYVLTTANQKVEEAKTIVKQTEKRANENMKKAQEYAKLAEGNAKNAQTTSEQAKAIVEQTEVRANEIIKKSEESADLAEESAIKAKETAVEAEESVKKAKELIDKLEAERNLLMLHTMLYTLFVLFANKNYYRLELETKKILTDLDSGKYLYISEEWKTDFIKMIDEKMLYFLNIDKKYRKDVSLHESVEALEELKDKISGLKVIE